MRAGLQSLWSKSKPMAKTWLSAELLDVIVDVSHEIKRICSHVCWGQGADAAILDGTVVGSCETRADQRHQHWRRWSPNSTQEQLVLWVAFLLVVTNIWLKPPKKGRVCFGSQFWGVTEHYGRRHDGESMRWLITSHLRSRNKARGMSVLSCWPLEWCHPHLGWVFPPQSTQCRNCLTGMPRGLFHGKF